MKNKIEELLRYYGMEWDDSEVCASKILDLFSVMQRDMLNDMIMQQEEIVSSPIRFNGVHVEKIKNIFKNNGTEYQPPF